MTGPRHAAEAVSASPPRNHDRGRSPCDTLGSRGAQAVTGLARSGGINPPITRAHGLSCDAAASMAAFRASPNIAPPTMTATWHRRSAPPAPAGHLFRLFAAAGIGGAPVPNSGC